jgi:hypothetical protein
MSVSVPEVVSVDLEEMTSLIGLVVLSLMINPVSQLSDLSVKVVCLHGGVINYGIIVALSIEIESSRRTVVLIESVSEDLSAFSFVLEEGSPDPFHLLSCESALLVLIV